MNYFRHTNSKLNFSDMKSLSLSKVKKRKNTEKYRDLKSPMESESSNSLSPRDGRYANLVKECLKEINEYAYDKDG